LLVEEGEGHPLLVGGGERHLLVEKGEGNLLVMLLIVQGEGQQQALALLL
jgi:hypothetical protein